MEKTLREKQMIEAERRMKMLKILPNVINEFKKGKLNYSERQNAQFPATLFWLKEDMEVYQKIKAFEEEYGALVYHVQLTHFFFGDAWSMMYVSQNEEEWERERKDIREGLMVVNTWCGTTTEIGTIGVKPVHGGVTRTE